MKALSINIDLDTEDLLTTATALAGSLSVENFVLSAAIEKAKQSIEYEQGLNLSRHDATLLAEALDRPAIANSKLKTAATCYQAKNK